MMDSWRFASIAALTIAVLASPARAADHGDSSAVIIDTDESMVLVGGDVRPSKPVAENLVAAGGRIVVDHPVGGHAVLAGGSIDLRGPVAGKLRAAGGSVSVESAVADGMSAVGGEVRITRDAVVDGYAHIMGGTITIDGRIVGPLKASADRIVINGEVTGDVRAAGEDIVLGPGAKIGGALRYSSNKDVTQGAGATVGGGLTRQAFDAKDADDVPHIKHRGATIAGTVFSFLALLGAGALFLSAAPIFSVETPDRIKSTPWKALGVGLLTVIGVPVLAVLFMITIVGIPVGLLLLLLYPFALLLGFIVATLFVGNSGASLIKRPPPPTIAAAIGYFAIALVVVMLLGKVPSVGGLVLCVLILFGVGAFEVELYRRMKGGAGARRVSSAAA